MVRKQINPTPFSTNKSPNDLPDENDGGEEGVKRRRCNQRPAERKDGMVELHLHAI